MLITRHVHFESRHPVDRVFDFSVDCQNFPKYVHKTGIIPGVERVEPEGEDPLAPGSRRRVHMTDGSSMVEELTACERPSRHAYRWASLPAVPFRWMVRAAEAHLRFMPTATGTRITWDYAFTLTTPLLYPVTALVLVLFEKWMDAAMANLETAITA